MLQNSLDILYVDLLSSVKNDVTCACSDLCEPVGQDINGCMSVLACACKWAFIHVPLHTFYILSVCKMCRQKSPLQGRTIQRVGKGSRRQNCMNLRATPEDIFHHEGLPL